MSNPRITFAIPYYRNLAYLRIAIESLIRQDSPEWLAIILDDCGGEDAEELVLSFKDERIRYVRNLTNLGLAENWNQGLELSETEFVTIFHSDDLLLPNYVSEMLEIMDTFPEAVAGHCRTEIVDEKGHKFWSFTDEFKKIIRPKGNGIVITNGESGLASLVSGSWIFCPTLCYRKKYVSEYRFNADWKFVVDVDFMSQILLSGGAIVGTPTIAYQYRRHRENQTAVLTKSLVRFEEELDFLNIIHDESRSRGWRKCAKRSKRKLILRFHLLYQGLKFFLVGEIKPAARSTTMSIRGRY